MKSLSDLKKEFKYWDVIADMIDQCIDISLNLSQSGHPGGSRSKVHVLVSTLLSGVMHWDIRNPGKTFADRFLLIAGHTNPLIYATLAIFNEALRLKYKKTGDSKYLNPMGEKYTLYWQDLLTLRRQGGLPGHAEMEGKTLFFKFNTGPSGHGSAPAAGEAFILKYAGAEDVKVFAFEGEGGLTTGISHETRNSAYGLGLGNLIYVVDWNDYGIDNRPFSNIMAGTPVEWFEPYGWRVAGTENGTDWESIIQAYEELLIKDIDPNQPKMLWVKTRKGRGYGKYDNASHGSPHKRNSLEFWNTRREFAEKYGVQFEHMDKPGFDDYESNKKQMADTFETVFFLFDKILGLTEYLSERLIELGESIPEHKEISSKFRENPLNDPVIYSYRDYPEELYKPPGTKAPNRAGFGNFGSWLNTYCKEKYGRPLVLVTSADLADSTNISGFAKGWNDSDDFGMFHREKNQQGTLLPQAITEFANAGIMAGITTVNFDEDPYAEFNGYITACSTYGSFSYLKYGAMRLFSQVAQDSQLKVGKIIWVAGHSGPETAEDSRTHFGIFSPGVTQLFPTGHILNLHPWEYNEVPVMLGAALATDIPIIAIHLTRPPIELPDRIALGMPSHFEAAKGAYVIKDYDFNREREGVVIVRGTSVISNLLTILPRIQNGGPNIKIVAALSWGLFETQSEEYKQSVMRDDEWSDAMIITNTAINLMSNWIKHSVVKEYSVSADWDNRWRGGGNLEEVIDEAHLSARWQWRAILKFAENRPDRLERIRSSVPKMEIPLVED
ncbi:MAG: transketolase [Candidatus Marinimicrobia bacterium]|nr:transketolase [Candidatus Neomarinimicrobiota bacterium]